MFVSRKKSAGILTKKSKGLFKRSVSKLKTKAKMRYVSFRTTTTYYAGDVQGL